MKTYKTLLLTEAFIFLVPTSLVAIMGGGYILTLQLFEKMRFQPLSAIFLSLVTVILLASLMSLWLILIGTIKNNVKTSNAKKSTLLFADIGAIFSLIILVSWLLVILFNSTNSFFNYASIFLLGTPALIPYLHLVYLNGGPLTQIANKALNTDSAKNAAPVS